MEDKAGLISDVAGQLHKLCFLFLTILAFACAVLLAIGPANWTRAMLYEQKNAEEWYVHALDFQAQSVAAKTKAKPKTGTAAKGAPSTSSAAAPAPSTSASPPVDPHEAADPGFEKVIATLNSKEFAAVHPGRENQILRTSSYLHWYSLNLKDIRGSRAKALERAGALSAAKLPFVDFDVNMRDFTASASALLSVLILGLIALTARLKLAIGLVTENYTPTDTANLRRELVRAGLRHRLIPEGVIRYQGCPLALATSIAASVFCALLAYYCLHKDGAMWQFLIQNPARAWLTAGFLASFAIACGFALASQVRGSVIAPKEPEPASEREHGAR